jgi:dephospho-CoA kinase
MLRVGLTGGIGSGKSTVAKIFEVLGIPVYYADEAAKNIMNRDPELKEKIIEAFGPESYVNNELNRPYISSIVFNNTEKLDLLNSLTHPATIRDAESWMLQQNAPYVLKEAALIFESGSAENLDYVIGVFSPLSLRIKRIMDRDNVTREEVMKRMSRQIDEDIKMRLCDKVIVNDEQQLVVTQVLTLHQELLSMRN